MLGSSLLGVISACVLLWYEFSYSPLPWNECAVVHIPMPTAWEIRYARETEGSGSQIALIRQSAQKGIWIALFPDDTLKGVRIGDKKTITASPKAGTYYAPLPVLDHPRKQAIMARAEPLAVANAPLVMFGAFNPLPAGIGGVLRRITSALAIAPGGTARWARWALRSKTRFFGSLAIIYLVYEMTIIMGVWENVRQGVRMLQMTFESIKTDIADISEWAAEVFEMAEKVYCTVQKYISPTRAAMLVVAISGLVMAAWGEKTEDEAASPTSSQATSPATTPPDSPRTRPTWEMQTLIQQVTSLIEEQNRRVDERLTKAIEDQQDLKEKVAQSRDDMAAQKLLTEATRLDRAFGEEDRKELKRMREQVQKFEEMIRKDRAPAIRNSTEDGFTTPRASNRSRSAEAMLETPPKTKPPEEEPLEKLENDKSKETLAEAKRRLEKNSREPHAVFSAALGEFREVDQNEWNCQFPVGFRTRLAPTFLAEVFSEGQRATIWAKNWLRERDLLECDTARELVGVMQALDSMLLVDGTPNFINQIGVERLARKALGIVYAYKSCNKKADWLKPPNAKDGKWESKVDWSAAKRVDPALAEEESTFVDRVSQDEIRAEMEREANLVKAKSKLDQVKKNGSG